MIQLPNVSEKQEKEYLANVKDSYKESLKNLKDLKVKVKKKKDETEEDYQKREEMYLSEVKAIVDFLSTEGKLDDDRIKNILVGEVPYLEKAMVKIGQIE